MAAKSPVFIFLFFLQLFAYSEGKIERTIRAGNVDELRQILKNGVLVNEPVTSNGETIAMIAAEGSTPDVVQVAIDYGADLHLRDKLGRTALHHAAYYGMTKNIDLLLRNGVSVNSSLPYEFTVLMQAALNGKADSVQFLVAHGADVNAQDGSGNTALIHSVWGNNPLTVKTLLDAGADPSIRNKDNETALDIANGNKTVDIINLLESR